MDYLELMKELSQPTPSRIILLVIDGLGGLPLLVTGKTELETAKLPNLNRLAVEGICGLSDPVAPGITPGSAPGHLGLFGYDPVKYNPGRGVLEATGIDFPLQAGDVAVRGNFCTVDSAGLITDRRAGRISTEKCAELTKLLNGQIIDGVEIFVCPVKEHRFVAVFRGEGIIQGVTDSDPQGTGVPSLAVKAETHESAKLAAVANGFIARAKTILANSAPANMLLLRGFSGEPGFPSMQEMYKLNPAAVAGYPMYRGLARLVGMKTLDTGSAIGDIFRTVKENYMRYDFFFVHIKPTDSAGEDGNFTRKVQILEELDSHLPELTALNPDVLVITGDHSTPAALKGHSWHPVPVLIHAKHCRPDRVTEFSESACINGGLGRISAVQLMPLAMANAFKLLKFGA